MIWCKCLGPLLTPVPHFIPYAVSYFAVVLTFLVQAAPAFSHNLPAPVRQALKQAGIPESAVGVYVHEISATQPLLQLNAGVAMNPASVMKLVTTFAGLELLGPAYTWKTELYADGLRNGDTLQGNLIIKGYGDPKLNLENFWLLTRRLRQTGLREIAGDLMLDNSHFDLPNAHPADFDGKPHRAYNVLPEALLVNYRTLAIRLIPQPESKTIRIVVDPLPALLDLKNNLMLSNGPCSDWRDALATDIRIDPQDNSRVSIIFDGNYSTHCGEKTLFLSIHDNAYYILSLFRQLWQEQGGTFRGRAISGTVPEGLLPVEIHQSPPLADIVRDINKFSNNAAARQLYLALGLAASGANGATAMTTGVTSGMTSGSAGNTRGSAEKDYGVPGVPPATLAKSDFAIRRWLTSKRLSFPELIIENGSGLSRNERISARHLGQLLLAAFQSPVMPEFISSLPIAAVDGTMKKRLNGSATAGQAHIKTGLLDGVRTMAGYMLDRSGRRVVIVFLINHPKSGNAQSAMDGLVDWVYEFPDKRS
ncbi:D-alanyl-D-alanine carboxypeptidase/D-alanyl-D-alanine endopeptidase [Nitrosovibrio tenuis]|uniref:D-alanyl-D-alanine carboxypeptidase / D-alanyl-D-alanine-endopeptidase (Penicillin-binding protein 4) n=1 Tax=Nitrosovibrio tenuis TaxID=1233 RepID=A0A1H7NCZ2_9PROT|nr:D-alanyl-D-alanine carboxypeptidase/D-alanyl-D-alanine-endopeptidase [Nitrosovibrio tenuis]SEL20797.1 D-alanyl-D-alanine carboxypeptidase / D-alanyl-D-alanine-endopeptidase (penicillin-binding protein 4) [Nitrosovibrio tenuis]